MPRYAQNKLKSAAAAAAAATTTTTTTHTICRHRRFVQILLLSSSLLISGRRRTSIKFLVRFEAKLFPQSILFTEPFQFCSTIMNCFKLFTLLGADSQTFKSTSSCCENTCLHMVGKVPWIHVQPCLINSWLLQVMNRPFILSLQLNTATSTVTTTSTVLLLLSC